MRKESFISLLHLAVIVFMWTSPFILDWKWVFILISAYYIQLLVVGGCILTKAQFGKVEDEGFYYHYLKKMGLPVSRSKVNFAVDFIIPPLLLTIALVRTF